MIHKDDLGLRLVITQSNPLFRPLMESLGATITENGTYFFSKEPTAQMIGTKLVVSIGDTSVEYNVDGVVGAGYIDELMIDAKFISKDQGKLR